MAEGYDIQIVIPVYNASKTIVKCLDSLKNQTFEDWQALCIDDCSTDGSFKVLCEYAKTEPRVRVMQNQSNLGASGARNKLLELADAEYIMFVDGDDSIEPDMLKTMYDFAKNGFDVVQSGFVYDFENGKSIVPNGAFKRDTELCGKRIKKVYLKMSCGINMNHVCMKLIRREVINGIRFDESMKTGEDLVFCTQMFENVDSYKFINKPFYRYFRSQNSLTGGGLGFKYKWKANIKAQNKIKQSMRRIGIKNPAYYIMASLRIYVVTISKIFRTLREKAFLRKGDADNEKT